MTLSQLEYLVAVETYGNFSEAATHCFVTQPTLSMQIQKLEEELGILIFNRGKHPVEATEIGEKVIRQARIILQEKNELQNVVEKETGDFSGRLRIGVIPTVSPYLLPMMLKSFTEKYPAVELLITEALTAEIVSSLNKDKVDVGILALPLNHPGIIEEALYYEPFIAYIPQTHKLYKKDSITIDDIDVEELLLLEEGHCFRDQALKICKSSERELCNKSSKVLFESGNLDTLKKLVENNFGITLLPYLAIQYFTNPDQKKLIRMFPDPAPKREIGLVFNKTISRIRLVKRLKEEILSVIPEKLKEEEQSLIIN
jgi:LysR family hydrogen peroxide-inducible transcriptional activator